MAEIPPFDTVARGVPGRHCPASAAVTNAANDDLPDRYARITLRHRRAQLEVLVTSLATAAWADKLGVVVGVEELDMTLTSPMSWMCYLTAPVDRLGMSAVVGAMVDAMIVCVRCYGY